MKCIYCQEEMVGEFYDRSRTRYRCTPCSASYVYNKITEGFMSWSFFYDNFCFCFWSLSFNWKNTNKPHFEIIAIGGIPAIIKLDCLPDLTPQNVAKKLPLYLTFL